MPAKIVDLYEYEHHVSADNKRFVKDFLTEKKSQGKRPNTVKQYEADLRVTLTYIYRNFDNKKLTELTKKDIRNFSIMLQDRGLSPNRVARLLSSLRSCLEYLTDDDDVSYEVNAGAKVKSPRIMPVREITFLREDQVAWLKERLVAEGETLMAVYFMLSYSSGKRKSEIHQVLKDGLTERLYTNTVTGKGGKRFRVFYDHDTQVLIKRYLDERGPDNIPELFVKVYRNGAKKTLNKHTFNAWTAKMSKLLSDYEGRPVYFRPHDLRHSRFDNLERRGVPLQKIKSLANHSNIATTEGYLQDRGEDDIAEIFGFERS